MLQDEPDTNDEADVNYRLQETDHFTFITTLQMNLERLSYEEICDLVQDPSDFIEELASQTPDPLWINDDGVMALLLLRQHHLTDSPDDINRASSLMLRSVSLPDASGYTHSFYCLASRCWDLYEETLNMKYLEHSMDLWEICRGVESPGSPRYLIAAIGLSTSYLVYSLRREVDEAREASLQIFNEAGTLHDRCTSSLGRERTLVIVGDILRHRYERFGPGEDLGSSIPLLISVLDGFTPRDISCASALEILSISVMVHLAQSTDHLLWLKILDGLRIAVRFLINGPSLSSTSYDNLLPPSSDNTASWDEPFHTISQAIDRCRPEAFNRAVCLVHLADLFVPTPNQTLPSICEIDDTAGEEVWQEAWEEACKRLQTVISSFIENDKKTPYQHQGHNFGLFRLTARLSHRPIPYGRTRFRKRQPVERHTCTFTFDPTPVTSEQVLPESSRQNWDHYQFFRWLQKTYLSLSREELDDILDNSLELDFPSLATVQESWVKSPGIRACLLAHRQRRWFGKQRDLVEAGQLMLSVKLEEEPGYGHALLTIASGLRGFETEECLGFATNLFKDFLKVQESGSPRHFITVIDLSSTLLLEALYSGNPCTLQASLDLLCEAAHLRGSGLLSVEGRRLIILGRVLHHRYKWFISSNEDLELSIVLMNRLLAILPVQPVFHFSTLELIAISTLLMLAENLDAKAWTPALELLLYALQRCTRGDIALGPESVHVEASDPLEPPNLSADIANTVSNVLDLGLDIIPLTLDNHAMCLIHVSDVLRCTSFDISLHPRSLQMSLEIYQKSLGLDLDLDDAHSLSNVAFSSSWREEYTRFRGSIRSVLAEKTISTAELGIRDCSFQIFSYHATRVKLTTTSRGTMAHGCIFQYRPILATISPKAAALRALRQRAQISGSSTETKTGSLPIDELATDAIANKDSHSKMPISSIMPGIEHILSDAKHPLFALPLEPRTNRSLILDVESRVRGIEVGMSKVSQELIRTTTEQGYWDPKDVLLASRMEKLKEGSAFLARMGPLQALLSRGPEICLELIEKSRALFWTRLLRLRIPVEGLPQELAVQIEDVASQLDQCKSQRVADVTRDDIQQQYTLEIRFERLLREVRAIPGFENFLQSKTHDVLMTASSEGPVVVLLGTASTYAALLVRPNGIDALYLESLTEEVFETLLIGFGQASQTSRDITSDPSDPSDVGDSERHFKPKNLKAAPKLSPHDDLLNKIWLHIGKPVLDRLEITSKSTPSERMRLWWCPTGRFTFLPLHAAGTRIGSTDGDYVSNYVVSSYIPTLSALLTAREKSETIPLGSQLKMLALAQPTTKGYNSLPKTLNELKVIQDLVPPAQLLRARDVDSEFSTSNTHLAVEEVTNYLTETSVLHLACHGHQDLDDPLKSGFELNNGRLTLSTLISHHTPHAFLAFLSACESASNDPSIPDESLNLSAAMLYAGFRSVIGTMWTMNDNDGPEVAKVVYEELFKHPDRELDPKVIPFALDLAVGQLRDKGIDSSRWATYIHVGM